MAALMRCVIPRYSNLGQSVLRVLSVSSNYGRGLSTVHRYAPTEPQFKEMIMTEVKNKVDHNVGVSTNLFNSLSASFEKSDSVTDQDIALLLHICSTGPFDLPTQKRSEAANEIWNKLEQIGVTPTIKLFNLRLKVYTSNKMPFNPVDELLKMKSLGLNPDRITYGFLIEGFCQKGDIEGANSVLEAMKISDYALGVGTFNSFITGHLKAGSPQEAVKVLEVMRSRGIAPNSDTYTRFAMHYAELGDIDSVIRYINEAESEGIVMDHGVLMDLYRTMVTSGHSHQTEKLLKIISEQGIFYNMSVQKLCQLTSDGFSEAALQLYLVTPKLDSTKATVNSGSFLLKTMIINGQSAEAVMELAEKIVENNVQAMPHRNALLSSYKAGRADLAMRLLELMKAKNQEIKARYIVPAICEYRKANNRKGLHKAVQMLLELEGDENIEDKVEMLLRFAYPALTLLKESREDIVNNFKGFEKTWNFVFFVNDVEESYSVALKNAAGKQLDGDLCAWYDFQYHITRYLPEEWKSYIDVLEHLSKQGIDKGVLMSLAFPAVRVSVQKEDWNTVEEILTTLKEKNLKLRRGVKQYFDKAPESIKTKIDELCESYNFRPNTSKSKLTLAELEELSKEELEKYQRDNPRLSLLQVALLDKALKTNKLDDIRQKLRELQVTEHKLSRFDLKKVISTLARLGDVETAISYFSELKNAVGKAYQHKLPLEIAAEQVKVGNIQGAMEMIRAAGESTFPRDEKIGYFKFKALTTMLLNAPSLDQAMELHAEILKFKSLVPEVDAGAVHSAYVKRVMEENDDDELLARLRKLQESHRVLPFMDQLLVKFIEKQDVARLKQVMDLGINVFGSNVFHHRLALSFVHCGMPKKALTVLLTPGLNIHERHFISGCRYFLKNKRIDCLESMVEITKNLPVSRSTILKYLLEGYVAVDKLDKATEVLEQFTHDLVTPPQETVDLLIKAYQSKDREVPRVLQALMSETKAEDGNVKSSSRSAYQSNEQVLPEK